MSYYPEELQAKITKAQQDELKNALCAATDATIRKKARRPRARNVQDRTADRATAGAINSRERIMDIRNRILENRLKKKRQTKKR